MHIAAADLQDIGVLGHRLNQVRLHHLGNHRQAGELPRLRQQTQTLNAKSLELVRRSARLKRSTTQYLRPSSFNSPGSRQQLFPALHCARPRHHHGRCRSAANDDRLATFPTIHPNAASLGFESPAYQFVRCVYLYNTFNRTLLANCPEGLCIELAIIQHNHLVFMHLRRGNRSLVASYLAEERRQEIALFATNLAAHNDNHP